MNKIEQFINQQYLNVETFRKNGTGVSTPVWFAQDGKSLRVWTQADSGKVKRIRHDGKVRIVPSTASGEPTGKWIDARAIALEDEREIRHTAELFKKKYGFMFHIFRWMGKLRGAKYATIHIELQ